MDLVNYDYGKNNLRTVMIDSVVWFVASDVCNVLEIVNTSQAMDRLSEKQKLIYTLYLSGQNRETWLVNESGLYKLILRSNKKEAEKFTDWVTDEVLPAIRRKGYYGENKGKLYNQQEVIRMLEKASFKSMTDSIQKYGENERMHGHAYSTYNNLVYKKVIGKTAQQIKNDFKLNKNQSVKDYIPEEKIKQIEALEKLVDSLLNLGLEYNSIKNMIETAHLTKQITKSAS